MIKHLLLCTLLTTTLEASDYIPTQLYSTCQPMMERAYGYEKNVENMDNVGILLNVRLIQHDIRQIHKLQANPKIDPVLRDVVLDKMLGELGRIIIRLNSYYLKGNQR